MNIIPERKCALIMYPSIFKLPKKEILVYSIADAKGKWEEETRLFIHDKLRMWVLSRGVSYALTSRLTSERKNAVNKLMFMFRDHESVRLHVLCKRIVEHGAHFVRLSPTKASRFHMHLKDVIAPILQWCEEYQQDYENFLKNLIKYN